MNDIEKLLAIESIKNSKARYFRGLDSKDWNLYGSSFAPDAEMDMREQSRDPNNLIVGRENIAAYVSRQLDGIITVHHGHTPEIEFTSNTTANVIWAMEDFLWKKDPAVQKPFSRLNGWGHYIETYRKVGDAWLIHTTTLTRLHMDMVP
jgi:hypothetical protein